MKGLQQLCCQNVRQEYTPYLLLRNKSCDRAPSSSTQILQYLSVWQSREWWEGVLSWRSYQLLRLKGTGDINRMGKMSSLLLLQLCEWEDGETKVDVEQK